MTERFNVDNITVAAGVATETTPEKPVSARAVPRDVLARQSSDWNSQLVRLAEQIADNQAKQTELRRRVAELRSILDKVPKPTSR